MAIILNGKELAALRSVELQKEILTLPTKPTLVIIQIGNVAESDIYIRRKIESGEKIGAEVIHKKYPIEVSEKDIVADIQDFSNDAAIHGIIVQLPIPDHLDKNTIIEAINPHKDVDGLTSYNVKKLTINNLGIVPATTKGILTLLKHYHIELQGKHVVVVGRSNLVGKPTAMACINENATVTICHSHTKELDAITKNADVIIAATGKRNLITPHHVHNSQIIIDVGIHSIENESNKIAGDVDFTHVEPLVHMISPVPGGVGPMTVISLFENLVDAYKKSR